MLDDLRNGGYNFSSFGVTRIVVDAQFNFDLRRSYSINAMSGGQDPIVTDERSAASKRARAARHGAHLDLPRPAVGFRHMSTHDARLIWRNRRLTAVRRRRHCHHRQQNDDTLQQLRIFG